MDEPTYTVFVRVPIPRGDFVDPPPVSSCSIRTCAGSAIAGLEGPKRMLADC